MDLLTAYLISLPIVWIAYIAASVVDYHKGVDLEVAWAFGMLLISFVPILNALLALYAAMHCLTGIDFGILVKGKKQ